MSSVFDWLEKNEAFTGALFGSVLPSMAASWMTKKPGQINPAEMSQMYALMAQGAVDANTFAKQQQAFYQQKFLPMATAIADRAGGIGHGQDLADTMADTKGMVDSAYAKRMSEAQSQQRKMGVDPTSSGAIASREEVNKGYTTDLLTSVNNAKTQREQYGDQARTSAAGLLNTKPDYAQAAYMASGAANGMANYNNQQQQLYQQQLSDTAYGLSDPWNRYQTGKQNNQYKAMMDEQMKWMQQRNAQMMGGGSPQTSSQYQQQLDSIWGN